METKKFAVYIRVSTQKQGRSGLGLEAQRAICTSFVASTGGMILQEFKDVESGTHRDRTGLWDAIAFCKENGCTLVIAKLDRLARDVEFTFKVINSGIDIHFCDMPVVNTMILGVFASVAQYERELTSKRTKDALAAKKARGYRLGNRKGVDLTSAQDASALSRRKKAQDNPANKMAWGCICDYMHRSGHEIKTADEYQEVVDTLNRMGIRTATGMEYTVQRLRSAYAKLKNLYVA